MRRRVRGSGRVLGFRRLAILVVVVLPALAAAAEEDRYPRGEIVPRIVCRSDPRFSFALYLPKKLDASGSRPLLLLFDARGRGALAAERFREGAERFGWMIISSNDTRSDDAAAPNGEAIQALWKDAQIRFPVDTRRIVTAGFSGGARLAFAVAMSRGSASGGVIAVSGGLPTGEPAKSDPGFPVFGTAGTRDFNYREMRSLDRSLEKTGASHRLEVFDGGHEWPPADVAARAVAWIEVQAMKRGTRGADPALSGQLLDEALARSRSLEAAGDLASAYETALSASRDFEKVAPTGKVRETAARLKAAALPLIAEAERRDVREDSTVRRLREELDKILADPDPLPFATVVSRLEIARLRERSASSSGPEADRLSAARIVEDLFAQTVFYRPRAFIEKNEPRKAALSLEIATSLKPDSPVAWYDLACARARSGDARRALEALRTALDRGFRDAKLLATDPDLDALRGLEEFRELTKKLAGS